MKELEVLFASARPPALMRAALLQEAGRPLLICDVPVPALTAGQLLVRLDACGICHTDLHVQSGGSPALRPLILGHEGIGQVASVGAKLIAALTPPRALRRRMASSSTSTA